MSSLRITEIFYSLQGEGRYVGLPTVFIRLTGCPLRCNYCDTEYAFSGGNIMMPDQIIDEIKQYKAKYICVTGGEPLAQNQVKSFLVELCDLDYSVSLETSGSFDISDIDHRVSIVMDLKTPSSTEMSKNLLANIPHLKALDQVKFVIADEDDYQWSKQQLMDFDLSSKVEDVLFSPSKDVLAVDTLAAWVLEDHLPVRLQVQLHKIIWGDAQGC